MENTAARQEDIQDTNNKQEQTTETNGNSIRLTLKTVDWKDEDNKVIMIDQTKLPNKLVYVEFDNYLQVADAIKNLVVRGAPAIGVAGAFGLALAAVHSKASSVDELIAELEKAKDVLFKTRPTAVNLAWGLEKVMKAAKDFAASATSSIPDGASAYEDSTSGSNALYSIKQEIIKTAKKMAQDDIETNMNLGKFGSELFNDNDTVMTHCNAGALATVGYGTALGVIRATKESGKNIKVIATETRPVMQGSRLTAFELQHDGFNVSLMSDTAVGYAMSKGLINKVVVGADRVLKTGHVFNKIGTYQIALMAKQHNIPFYVAAPLSTFDTKSDPEDIVIEQRKAEEVTGVGEKSTAPQGVDVINPAFDMTPPELIAGIITEKGVIKPPYEQSIGNVFKE